RYIVEDDYDSEFKYETDNIPSLHSLDRDQRVIYTGTFSKTLLPSFRISYMVLTPHLLREYRKRYMDLIQRNNSLSLFTLQYLIKQLKSRFKHLIHIDDVPAGLHFLAHFHTDQTYEAIEKRSIQEKLEIYSMRRFMLEHDIQEKHTVSLVIGFANIQKEQIHEAVDRLFRTIYPNDEHTY